MNTTNYRVYLQVIQSIRQFLAKEGLLEVITPVFNHAMPAGPGQNPFLTSWDTLAGKKTLYLSVFPERGMKKLLAHGLTDIFTFGKSFRNLEGGGETHNPEFIMLEWYRDNQPCETIMDDTKRLLLFVKESLDRQLSRPPSTVLKYQGGQFDLANWQTLSQAELFKQYTGVELSEVLTLSSMKPLAKQLGLTVVGATWEQLFNQIVLNEVEPHYPRSPFFLTDFPAQLSPLCAFQPDQPYLAQRFEVIINHLELGNGNTEELDSHRVRQMLTAHSKQYLIDTGIDLPTDEEFLADLKLLEGQHISGIGVGIERVAMLFAGAESIQELDPFCV